MSHEPKPQTDTIRDVDGREIPEHLQAVFASRKVFQQFASALTAFERQVKEAMAANPVAWSRFPVKAFRAALQNLRAQFLLSRPHIVCPFCGAFDSGNCRACKGTGFLTELQAKAVPEELRRRSKENVR